MKNKTFNSISIFALVIFLLSSVAYSQTNDDPNSKMMKHKHMDHKAMMDSCKMIMDKTQMPNSCKMKMDSCKTMMKNPKHMKMMKDHMMNNPEHKKMMKEHMKMDSNKTMMNDPEHKMMMKNMKDKMKMKDKSSMVREGVIDLGAIDKNKDGKVFQDVMDWNVISDKPGTCPLCGMKLKEVTLEKAKENLLKNGFKVK